MVDKRETKSSMRALQTQQRTLSITQALTRVVPSFKLYADLIRELRDAAEQEQVPELLAALELLAKPEQTAERALSDILTLTNSFNVSVPAQEIQASSLQQDLFEADDRARTASFVSRGETSNKRALQDQEVFANARDLGVVKKRKGNDKRSIFVPTIEFEDISMEVEAHLQRREAQDKANIEKEPHATKRKRRSESGEANDGDNVLAKEHALHHDISAEPSSRFMESCSVDNQARSRSERSSTLVTETRGREKRRRV